ncbi:uncharacterized protein CFAP92 [Bombina bombina]|uniref:uncharacterized protein CFAP92 n=1 Tax=Bombina bombina TaxID=8345 RepID=UPI00235A74E8|nr:uncharacterized protein CFAP92 [Bombina bombina]
METVGFGNLSPVNFEVVSDGNRMEQETAKKMIVKNVEDLSHIVTFTVTVAFAIPSQASKDGDFPSDKENTNQKKPKKIIDPTKPRGYYHFEYFLLPEDTGPTKVDVVMFGHMAKLYLESESKIIKPWTENEKIWLLWSHDVDLPVTKNFIQKSLKHKVQVKIWDTKEKVSSKARFDKPRTFKVRKGDYSEDEIRDLILSQIKHFEENQPRPSLVRHQNENRSRSWQDVTRSEMDRSQKLSSVSAHIPASTNPYLPNQVTGYIDDIFLVWRGGMEELQAWYNSFNNCTSNVKFKMTVDEHSISFLDLTVFKNSDNLGTTLYHKPTDRNSILRADSCHPPALLKGIVKSQFIRTMQNNSDSVTGVSQLAGVGERFRSRGYKTSVIQETMESVSKLTQSELIQPKPKRDTTDKLIMSTTFTPATKNTGQILRQHWPIMSSDPKLTFTKNLKPMKVTLVYHMELFCEIQGISVSQPLNAERFFPMMNTLNEMSASHTDFLDAEADLEKFKMKTRKYSVERKTDAMLKGNKNKKEILCMKMKLNFVHFVAGELSVTNRLKKTSNKILDCYMTLAINKPLLSEEQKRELNPLVIRILSATSLPASPTPISLLQEKCSPVFCKYKFHNQPVHKTHGQDHGTHVYFKDINVILAGTISPGQLHEFLHGPPIEIEVHDRDRKIEKSIIKPSLFGTEPEDEKFSNVGLVTSKRTVHNPFTKKDKMWNPYGVAKVSLSDLLHDASYLNISAPIHSCEAPDVSGYNADHKTGKIVRIHGSVDGPEDSPLPVGHYLDAQSLLKVRVDIAVPLSLELESSDCPYGRVIYIFDYTNKTLVYNILQKITKINAKALNLDVYPVDILQDVLSKISLKDFKKDDPPMDVITGVHVMDGAIHVFILEGLKDKAIKNLWESLPTKTTAENGMLKVLYNSGLSFSERLYKDLSSMVYHIRLHKHFSSIIKQPLLYIRDMVPSPCFQALSRLDYICHAKRLRDVIQGDLFPTEKMMSLLSQEFGVPVTLTNLLIETKEILRKPLHIDKPSKKRVLHSPIETFNEEYMQWKESENKTSKDYIQGNILFRPSMNAIIPTITGDEETFLPQDKSLSTNGSLWCGLGVSENPRSMVSSKSFTWLQQHNPSIDWSTPQQDLAEDPKSRFTYWQDNLRTTAGPMDKSKWITSNEFRYPGFKSSSESNEHPKKPDEARKMDLSKLPPVQESSKAWRENVLHANTLQPTLRRDRWSWTQRNIDFDLYRKPPRTFSAPVTIHHAGDTLQNIQKQAAEVEKQKWLQNIQVDDINMRFYRRLPETELIDKGPKASDQQSKLSGLLKDPPLKFSLRREGLSLKVRKQNAKGSVVSKLPV